MTHSISTSQLQEALSGISFPATKQDLIDQAHDNGANTAVINALSGLEEKEYSAVTEVQQAFSTTEA